jgi:hypothetical protein
MARGPDAARLTKAANVLLAVAAAMYLDATGDREPLRKLVKSGDGAVKRWSADESRPPIPLFAANPTNEVERRRVTPIENQITTSAEKMLASGKTREEAARFALDEVRHRIPNATLVPSDDPLDWDGPPSDRKIVAAIVAKLGPKRGSDSRAGVAVTIVHAVLRRFGIEPSRAKPKAKKTPA